jgi:hypothetical protein
MAELKRLSHTHEMMLNWLVLNPDRSLRECADHFGVSQSWLSSIIHSDIFQHALKEKQLAISLRVADSIPAKLRRAADIAVEKLTQKLEDTEDPEFILDATDKILHRMGFAPQSSRNPLGPPTGSGPVQQNNFFISAGDLAEARALIGNTQAQSLPAPEIVEGESVRVEPN